MSKSSKKIIALVAVIALVAMLAVCLVACNADSYVKRLKDAGYNAEAMTEEEIEKNGGSDKIEWGVVAVKGSVSLTSGVEGEMVTIVKYKNSDDAKKQEEDLKELMGDEKGAAVYRTGKIVMFGTEQGVKDAK